MTTGRPPTLSSVPDSRRTTCAAESSTCAPQAAAQPDIDAGLLTSMPMHITPEEPVGLMLPADVSPSPALQALIGALRQPLHELPQNDNFELVGYHPLPNPGDTIARGRNGPTGARSGPVGKPCSWPRMNSTERWISSQRT